MHTMVILTSLMTAPSPVSPGTHRLSVRIEDTERTYLLHVPAAYDGLRALPVVLCFHGGGSNPRQQMFYCGLNDKADAEGFFVVYPDGSGRLENVRTWNAGICCGYAERQNIDDVAFTRALLDDLEQRVKLDAGRVYATGISNGGMMAYRLASELSDRIAAIASVAGTMGTETCRPSRPVPILHLHGTQDEFLSIEGGPGPRSITRTTFYSVEHTMQQWAEANGCPHKPVVTRMPDTSRDGMTVEQRLYGPGRDGAEVVLYVIENGGHTWPGRATRVKRLGASTQDISANDIMWEFFRRHPLR